MPNGSQMQIRKIICCKSNATNHTDHRRTLFEVRKKWTSYMSSVKNAASNNRRDRQKKGSEELTRVQDKVVEMFEETPKELTQTLDNLVK